MMRIAASSESASKVIRPPDLSAYRPAEVLGQSKVVPVRGVLRRDCPDPVGLLFHRVGIRDPHRSLPVGSITCAGLVGWLPLSGVDAHDDRIRLSCYIAIEYVLRR
jgi:hypothetical protein